MGCQNAYYFADKELLFVCTGDTTHANDYSNVRLYDAIKYFVFENIGEPIPEGAAYKELKEKLGALHLPYFGEAHSENESYVSGVSYTLDENDMGWSDFMLEIGEDEGSITYRNARGEKTIRFGIGKFLSTTFPETHYYDSQRGVPSGRELNCLAIAEWREPKKLLIRVYITDITFGSIFATISFKDDMAALQFNTRGEFIHEDYGGVALGHRSND